MVLWMEKIIPAFSITKFKEKSELLKYFARIYLLNVCEYCNANLLVVFYV